MSSCLWLFIAIYILFSIVNETIGAQCPVNKIFYGQSFASTDVRYLLVRYSRPWSGDKCERTCRQYRHCHGYLITWVDEARLHGDCQILTKHSGSLSNGIEENTVGELYGRVHVKYV